MSEQKNLDKQFKYFQLYEKFMKNIKNPEDILISSLNKNTTFFTSIYQLIKLLPKNTYILGKPSGTVFYRNIGRNSKDNFVYTARVNPNGKLKEKNFSVNQYGKVKAKEEAEKWRITMSYQLNMTSNLIKIHNDNTISVELTKGKIMKTDSIFLPLVQSIKLCLSTSGSGKDYSLAQTQTEKNYYFHSLITCFNLTDHINGNALDNRLINLRPASVSLNNRNRITLTNESNIHAIKKNDILTHYCTKLKIDSVEFIKFFSVTKYGLNRAKQLATEYRDKIITINNIHLVITPNDTKDIYKILIARLNQFINMAHTSICFTQDKYLENCNLNSITRNEIYNFYIDRYTKHLKEYTDSKNIVLQKYKDNFGIDFIL